MLKPPTNLPPPEVVPDALLERRFRRVFSSEYKINILGETGQSKRGELGPLLRRESLFNN